MTFVYFNLQFMLATASCGLILGVGVQRLGLWQGLTRVEARPITIILEIYILGLGHG